MKHCIAFALAALLTACDGVTTAPTTTSPEPAAPSRTCESIRADVVRLTENNPTSIVKIYDPKTVKDEPKKVSCIGRAMLSNTQEATVYYRAFQDADGEWFVAYSDKPLEE